MHDRVLTDKKIGFFNICIVLVSTFASELYFSAANRVLTDKKMRLGEKIFEALVLLKDWYDTVSRLQRKS
jgi:hAT family C-terminal dimerisation region